jgi:hypothetical protein
MSESKIWCKIVSDEVMQTHHEDPSGLWHPDMIEKNELNGHWEELPDYVNVGWKLKNGAWISGGQWMDEHKAENPLPPPGPPIGRIDITVQPNNQTHIAKVTFDVHVGGIYDTWYLEIDGKTYEEHGVDEKLILEFEQGDEDREVPISIYTIGPGGTHEEHLHKDVEEERKCIIPAKWVPPFMKALGAAGKI